MANNSSGTFRLFQAFGINVRLHWTWFLLAAYELDTRKGLYHSPAWNIAEYLSLFFIVLLHEFGHALACKQTGGGADEIILWPLGGIAYVRPPNRPGAILWSIAAGPLVNVALVPVIFVAGMVAAQIGLSQANPDLRRFIAILRQMNLILLVFNMLPVYPLDGGQILRSLLWFVIGPVRSLYAAVAAGFAGACAMGLFALVTANFWFGILAVFVFMRCMAGFQQARTLGKIEALPRHADFKCPRCGEAPFAGTFWTCSKCMKPFDTFETGARCPQCGGEFEITTCPSCRQQSPFAAWRKGPPPL